MSNEAITWVYGLSNVAGGAKFVLVALADKADEDNSCYPGQALLASMTGQGVRTVRRQLLELEMAGFIVRKRRFDSAGHRTSDRYYLPVGQAIPTGQSGQRPNRPVAKSASGHSGQRPDTTSLPAIYDSPTGQIGQVSLSEPPEEPTVEKNARGSRLPDKWQPSAALIAWARNEGVPDEMQRKQTDNFRDYWAAQPGTRGRKADWDATWRTWIRRAAESPSGRGQPRASTTDSRVSAALTLADQLERKAIG